MLLIKTLLAVLLPVMVSTASAVNYYKVLFDEAEFKCLVKNIYYESRGEPVKGQEAVALVTLNRLKSPRFSNSVCKVVYKHKQFSWTANRKLMMTDKVALAKAKLVAYRVLIGDHSLGNFKATNFHAKYVNPGWGLTKVATIGQHIFYI